MSLKDYIGAEYTRGSFNAHLLFLRFFPIEVWFCYQPDSQYVTKYVSVTFQFWLERDL